MRKFEEKAKVKQFSTLFCEKNKSYLSQKLCVSEKKFTLTNLTREFLSAKGKHEKYLDVCSSDFISASKLFVQKPLFILHEFHSSTVPARI